VDVLAPLVVIALLALVVLLVSAPLRRDTVEAAAAREDARLADLEDAKDAKYREIREAELEYRTGHLSEADWRLVDRQLRAEAVVILREIDALGHARGQQGEPVPGEDGDRSQA
jgi:heme exporter protein D